MPLIFVIWPYLLIGLIAFAGGFLMFAFRVSKMISGDLRVISSEEGGDPYLFCELDKSPSELKNGTYVVLRVHTHN